MVFIATLQLCTPAWTLESLESQSGARGLTLRETGGGA